MTEVFYISNWPYHEHADMSKIKTIKWVKAKVDFQGDDWRKLVALPNRCTVLAVWEIVRAIAVSSPYRGLLLTDGHKTEPHTIESIAAKSGFSCDEVRAGCETLLRIVGWLSACQVDASYAKLSCRLWGKSFCGKEKRRARISGKFPKNSENHPENFRATLHNITEQLNPPTPLERGAEFSASQLADEFIERSGWVGNKRRVIKCAEQALTEFDGGRIDEAMATVTRGTKPWEWLDALRGRTNGRVEPSGPRVPEYNPGPELTPEQKAAAAVAREEALARMRDALAGKAGEP